MKKIYYILFVALFGISGCKDDPDPVPQEPGSPPDNYINAIYIADSGIKYFATKNGLASFDGDNWTTYDQNPVITTSEINDLDYEITTEGPALWLGTNNGLTAAVLPIDGVSSATTYTKDNTKMLYPGQSGLTGDTVRVVMVDNKKIRWLATNDGISVFKGEHWPSIDFSSFYSLRFFKSNKITSFGFNNDTVYIGTMGGGVARMTTESVDAISAASPYEVPWSQLASENILSVFVDGSVQWYGTDSGVTKHTGTEAKLNWDTYHESDGLIDNRVQCIIKDAEGNMWFGTPDGVSKFDGYQWTSFTKNDGLAGNNVLCAAADNDGSIWFGTDSGISHYRDGSWITYKAD